MLACRLLIILLQYPTGCKLLSKEWPLKRHQRRDLPHLLVWQVEQRLVQRPRVPRGQRPQVLPLAKSEWLRPSLALPKPLLLWP